MYRQPYELVNPVLIYRYTEANYLTITWHLHMSLQFSLLTLALFKLSARTNKVGRNMTLKQTLINLCYVFLGNTVYAIYRLIILQFMKFGLP